MTQQVNLYQPILRREKKVFSALTMLQVLGVMTIVMLAMFAFNRWQLSALEAERGRLQAQEQKLAAQVMEISRNAQVRPESRELRRQVELARREVQLKQRLSDLMRSSPGSAARGFSDAFAGLARQRVAGLWLTGIEIHKEGTTREIMLRGYTAQAALVPQLVQQLGQEPAFQGLRFRQLRVFQPENENSNVLAFELSTRPPEETSK